MRAFPPNPAAERDPRRQQHPARERRVIHPVDDRRAPLPALQPAQARLAEMPAQHGPLLIAKLPQLQKPLPHRGDVRIAVRDRFPKRDGHRIRNAVREFREKLPALEREDRAPEPVHPHRHDGAFRAARDQLIAALQPQQDAAPREFALGENAHDLPALDQLRRLPHRVLRAPRRDGHRAHAAEDPVQHRDLVNILPHDEPDRPRTRELEHDRVDPRQVIRQQQKAPLRQRPHPMRRHTIDEPPDECADGSDEAFGEGRGAIHGAGVFDFSAR